MREKLADVTGSKYRRTLRKLIIDYKLTYTGVCDWYLFSLFVLPSYFGIRMVFFDLTAFRFFEILLIILIWKNLDRKKQLTSLFKKCPYNLFIFIYMFIVIFTNLVHPSLNTIFYWVTNAIVPFYLCTYLIVYEYGLAVFVEKIRTYLYILTIISPLQLVTRYSPFLILHTLNTKITDASRAGNIRITGNQTTSNGYGLMLIMLLPFCCYSFSKRKVNIFEHKVLLLLIGLNIFLTGARLTVGTAILTLGLLFLVQARQEQKNTILILLLGLPYIGILLFIFKDIRVVRGILSTFFSAVDEILKTNIAANFGVDTKQLYNSTRYRELLVQYTFAGGWLNPLIGKGGGYTLHMFVERYDILSVDNYYVGQYVAYAWPGLITWLLMSFRFLLDVLLGWFRKKEPFCWVIATSIMVYYLSLWYLDHLQTFKIMMTVFSMIYAFDILFKHSNIIEGKTS